jgi:hypothetical protein
VRRPVAAIAVAALLVGACSSGDDDAAPSTTSAKALFDACSVLRTADVVRLTGVELRGRQPDAESNNKRCFYNLADNTNVNVTIDYEQGKAFFGPAGQGTPVPDVGDEAKWVGASQLLAAYQGSHYVAVLVVTKDPEDVRQRKAAAIARVVLARMQ